MPLGDGTGPMGLGPTTGRAAGYCAGFPVPGFTNPIGGRLGLGRGWFGRGRGFWPYAYYGRGRFVGIPYSYGGLPYGGFARPYGYLPRVW
jgi:hypothetical protein